MVDGNGAIQLDDVAWIAMPDPELEASLTTFSDPCTCEMATQDDFHLLRIIGNLKISGGGQEFFEFKPPARLQVRFTGDDLNRAQRRGKPLALAYWWEGHWVRFEPGSIPANPEAEGDDWAYFLISEIPDPPIAWGT
jgi:hypothetical protein